MNPSKISGLVAATHTPFHANGDLNLGLVEKQAEFLRADGVTWLFIGGTTGESHSLSLDERRALATRWMEVARGTDLKIIVHVGSNCLADARVLARQAGELGAAAIAALSPSYFKPRNVETLVACAAEVASAAPATPFYFYDIPALTGVNLSMPDFLALGAERIPTLAGIKFTNPDLMAFQSCLRIQNGRFDIPWGYDEHLLAALALGATGAVGSTYNFAAPIYHRLMAAFGRDDLENARQEQFRSVRLVQLLAGRGYMGAAKATMALRGVDVGPARLPNGNLSSEEKKLLAQELEALGFFDWVRK